MQTFIVEPATQETGKYEGIAYDAYNGIIAEWWDATSHSHQRIQKQISRRCIEENVYQSTNIISHSSKSEDHLHEIMNGKQYHCDEKKPTWSFVYLILVSATNSTPINCSRCAYQSSNLQCIVFRHLGEYVLYWYKFRNAFWMYTHYCFC